MTRAIRGLSLAAIALVALPAASGDSQPETAAPEALGIEVNFKALDFGRGPPDAKPIRAVEGTFALEYDPAQPSDATLQRFELRTVNSPGRSGWAEAFTAEDVVLEVSPTSIQVGGHAPLSPVSGSSDDFLIQLRFDAQNPDSAPSRFEKFAYAVASDPEVYETNKGSVTLKRLPTQD